MQLEKVVIAAFGRLLELSLVFHPRFTLIYGENEAGKSTLQQALLHLLFGFYHSNRATPQESQLLQRYRPWLSDRYGGQLWYGLKEGGRFQVTRDFSHSDIPTHIFDALTGEDITHRFSVKRHGNISFLKEQLGMDKEIFEATVFVRQAEVKAIVGSAHLLNEIIGILDSGTREKSAKQAILHLQNEISKIGSERAQKKPLPLAKARLKTLQDEYAAQTQARKELKQAIEEKNHLEQIIAHENERRIELNYQILTRRIEQREKQLKRLQSVRKELTNLEKEMKDYQDVAEFPEEIRDVVFRRQNNRKNYEEQIQEKQKVRSEKAQQLESLEKELAPLIRYEKIVSLMNYDEFIRLREEWQQRNDLFIRARRSVDQEEVSLLQDGTDPKTLQELSELKPEDFARLNQLEEAHKRGAERIRDLEQELGQLESVTWAKRKAKTWIILGSTFISLVIFLSSYFLNFVFGYPIGVGVVILGMIVYLFYRRARRRIARKGDALEERLREQRQEMETHRAELQPTYSRFGVDSITKLMARRVQHEHYLELVRERDLARKECERVEFQLLKYLQVLDIETIGSEVLDTVAHDYGRFYQQYQQKNVWLQEIGQLERQIAQLKEKMEDNQAALKELFQQVGIEVDDIARAEEEFNRLYQRRKGFNRLKREHTRHQSEVNGIVSSQSEEEMLKELEEWLSRREELLANHPGVKGKRSTHPLPQLERDFSAVDQSCQQHEKQVQALQSRIETVLEQHRSKAEIEEEIAQVQTEIQRLEEARATLELARENLEEVSQQYHRNVVPFINTALSQAIGKITNNRYTEVRVNPNDLSLNLVLPEKQAPGTSDLVSLGTQEQLYLLLRVALARLLSQNMEPLPLILDDPFVHFDRERMANMLEFLYELSRDNQVLLFTKEPFIVDWCTTHLEAQNFQKVDLSSPQDRQFEAPVF